MKKFLKIIVFLVIGAIILIGSGLTYVKVALPDVGAAPALNVDLTPARIERGKYLANHVTVCMDCHSPRKWDEFAAPMDSNNIGVGGERFDQKMGFPGEFHSANITPYNLKNWTDGELFRTITTGVTKDGRALFPVMPYLSYGKMSREDILSIIAYIRTLKEKESHPATSHPDFPMNFIINTIPVEAKLAESIPAKKDTVLYGAYLVNASACPECHTRQEKGKPVEGMDFAGGFSFKFPGGTTYSANITPDKTTGIGAWSREQFIARFKVFAGSGYQAPKVGPEDFQTVMPWEMYAGMTEEDLGAIYSYLKTVKPVTNRVAKFVKE
jgi:mono/diheme cytochrome c family protein